MIEQVVNVLGAAERDAIASGLATSLRDTVAALDPAESRRWWRLVATEEFDAWLIDWPPGTSVPRHDHDGAAASIRLVRGSLVETRFDAAGGVRRLALSADASHHVPAEVTHELGNRGRVDATSVHVYSPPLRSMAFYDHDGAPTRRDEVAPSPTLWSLELT
jgi:hypothetical protein